MKNHVVPNTSLQQRYATNQEVQKAKEKIQEALEHSNDTLINASTVFPFTLFPDTIIIDREKVTITHRTFFKVGEIMSIRIEDILNVTADVGPFFGSIKFATRFFDPNKPYIIHWFWRQDALKIKQIMQGYIIALQKKIDCAVLSTPELVRVLKELGRDSEHVHV